MRISDCGLKKKTAKTDVKKIPLAHAGWKHKTNKIQYVNLNLALLLFFS